MALSIFDDPPTGSDNEPMTVKRYMAKRNKAKPIGAPQESDGEDYSQTSSMMPGKPQSATKKPLDPDKREAILRRLRKQGVS